MIKTFLRVIDINLAHASGMKIGNLIKQKKNNECNYNSFVYKIPCGSCEPIYIDESLPGFYKRMNEHTKTIPIISGQVISWLSLHKNMATFQDEMKPRCHLKRQWNTHAPTYITTGKVTNPRGRFVSVSFFITAAAGYKEEDGAWNNHKKSRKGDLIGEPTWIVYMLPYFLVSHSLWRRQLVGTLRE